MRLGSILLSLMLFLAALAAPLAAQDSTRTFGPLGDHLAQSSSKNVDIITPHITDAHEVELPGGYEWHLPRWTPVHVGGVTVDLSPTKHVIFLLLAALLCIGIMIPAAMSNERQTAHKGHAHGFAGAIESVVLYLRNEVILPNVGHHGNAYVPFALTLFFFILFANLLGLIPYGSTATGNVSVTATLAVIAFFVIEIAGMRALGKDYVSTVFYWPHDMPVWGRMLMTVIMTPVEILGKFTKPFALAIRLFANMTAGHVMVLALISIVFMFGSVLIGVLPVLMAVGIMCLELFVAFLQAYVFTLLVASFLGQIRTAEHH